MLSYLTCLWQIKICFIKPIRECEEYISFQKKKEDIFSDNPITVITNDDIKRIKRRELI